MKDEILIYPARVTDLENGGTKPYSMYEAYKDKELGTQIHASAGAPGIGHTIHEITRIDETGIYGTLIEDTMQVPDIEFYR